MKDCEDCKKSKYNSEVSYLILFNAIGIFIFALLLLIANEIIPAMIMMGIMYYVTVNYARVCNEWDRFKEVKK